MGHLIMLSGIASWVLIDPSSWWSLITPALFLIGLEILELRP